MQHFKNSSDEVFAFDDEVTIEQIEAIHGAGTLTSITEDQANTIRNPSPDQQLTDAKNSKASEFSRLCGERIKSGFTSNALGSNNAYRCKLEDQADMRYATESSSGGDIWVGESYTHHTQPQAQTVYGLAKSHVATTKSSYSSKYSEVQAATNIAAVNAITWPES